MKDMKKETMMWKLETADLRKGRRGAHSSKDFWKELNNNAQKADIEAGLLNIENGNKKDIHPGNHCFL